MLIVFHYLLLVTRFVNSRRPSSVVYFENVNGVEKNRSMVCREMPNELGIGISAANEILHQHLVGLCWKSSMDDLQNRCSTLLQEMNHVFTVQIF